MKNVFAGVGISKLDDPYKAGREAVSNALEDMKKRGGKELTFGLVFCSGEKYATSDSQIQKLVDGVHSIFNDIPWVGCTSAGEITNLGFFTHSCVAMAVSSEYIHVGVGIGENVLKKPKEAGFKAAEMAMKNLHLDKYLDPYIQFTKMRKYPPNQLAKMNPFSILFFGKGLEKSLIPGIPKIYDNDLVFDGVINAVGNNVPVVGGCSFSSKDKILKNYHFANGKLIKDGVVAMAVFSNVYSSTGLAHGYEPTEKVGIVNDVDGFWVKRINEKNPIEAYAELMEVKKEDVEKNPVDVCSLNPIGISDPSGEYWIRIPTATKMGRLCVVPKLHRNSLIHVMSGNKKNLLNAAKEAVKKALVQIGNKKPSLAFVFGCCIRAKALGKEVSKEIETLSKFLKDTPFIGFYTAGEFGETKGRRMGLHALTITTYVLSDDILR